MNINEMQLYDRIGEDGFARLVAAFYAQIPADDILGPMYPADDLAGAQRRLTLFLEQYWGGPDTYNQERGHPRLRMRHAAFPIDAAARDRWLRLMREALAEQDLPAEADSVLWQYLLGAAFAMQNITDDAPPANAIDVMEV